MAREGVILFDSTGSIWLGIPAQTLLAIEQTAMLNCIDWNGCMRGHLQLRTPNLRLEPCHGTCSARHEVEPDSRLVEGAGGDRPARPGEQALFDANPRKVVVVAGGNIRSPHRRGNPRVPSRKL